MDISTAQTVVRPEVNYLTDVLDDISKGTLRVPRFQRPFVWKLEAMIDLFDSILKGYPIGSLLFWKTGTRRYETFDFVGNRNIPTNTQLPINYILDGHQRLSTLFGVLSSDKDNIREASNHTWNIYYNLRDKSFLHIKKDTDVQPHYISLRKLLRTVDFLSECKRIQEKVQGESSAALIQEAENLLSIIRGYRIAIIQIEGGEIDSAVQIFSRLNTKGEKMADDRMYAALTYKEGQFNLSDKIDDIIDSLRMYHFHNIDRTIVFRMILAAAEKDIYTDSKLDLFEKTNNLEDIVREAEVAIIKAANFLHTDLHIPSDNFLPYSLQLLNISEFFRLCPQPNDIKLQQLRQWFWVTSFVGIENTNTSKKLATINEMRDFARADAHSLFTFKIVNFLEKATPFPSRYNLISARTKAFTLFLSSLNPKSLNQSDTIDTKELLANNGYRAFNYIFATDNTGRVANRIIANSRDDVKEFLNTIRLQSLFFEVTETLLESHAINQEAFNALVQNKKDDFLALRERELIRLEKDFLIEKGVIPYDGFEPRDTVNDSENNDASI